ncbi:hypothetical protein CIFRMM088M_02065 [Citrobacter freundii]|nr:hypothetical protein B9P86_06015 [Citrobacter freundii]POV57020.1 hypothetical protein C3404_27120 [Citrobacter freundii complex sp. CFNIH11]QFI11410.1 hypothetical protein FR864_13055 [Citrobacter freundii]QFI27797.1 hypothetical protein FR801_13145 [Citrobacter freundii]THE34951.1 hypothetical protein DJ483_24095 [Citrobacter freundii]
MYLSLRLIVFFLCNCRVIKQVDYILLILQRVFYSGCALGESHLIVKLCDVLHSCVLESFKSLHSNLNNIQEVTKTIAFSVGIRSIVNTNVPHTDVNHPPSWRGIDATYQ